MESRKETPLKNPPDCIMMGSPNSPPKEDPIQDRMKITSLLHPEDMDIPPPVLSKSDFKCLPFFNHLLQDVPSAATRPFLVFPSNFNSSPSINKPQTLLWTPIIPQVMITEPTTIPPVGWDRLLCNKRKNEDSGSDTDSKRSRQERLFKVPKNRPKNGAFERQWMEHFEQLKEFKEVHGHTNVTRSTKGHGNLGNWLAEQRRKLRRGKLLQKQYELLDSLGVEWDRSHYFLPKVYADLPHSE